MASKGVPALLDALFVYVKAVGLDNEDKSSLRLCSKHLKNLVDATVTKATVASSSGHLNTALNALINTEWHDLQELNVAGTLPSSLGKLTALEKISLMGCRDLTAEGLSPLQHLTGLTSLEIGSLGDTLKMTKFPDFIWNLTSLKELWLYSSSIKTLPDALGNLTNLKTLAIGLNGIEKLPESIGHLNALKEINLHGCRNLTTLPESLDDLLWRKADETGEFKKMKLAQFFNCPKLVLSPKMKQSLEVMRGNGVRVLCSMEDFDEEESDDESEDGNEDDDDDDE